MKQVAIICALMGVLCLSTPFAQSQTPNATLPQGTPGGGVAADPAITATRVRGEVTAIDPTSKQLTVRTAAGNVLTVQLGEQTTYQRMPVGETALDKAVKIALTDIALGDQVYARGRVAEDRRSVPAQVIIVRLAARAGQGRTRRLDRGRHGETR